ncbi:MAG TPA: SRPBCC family protein [Gemmatimonadales bacterium]
MRAVITNILGRLYPGTLMRPVTHTLIEKLRAPIDRVFALLTDPARMPQWLPGCSGVDGNGGIKKGARIKPHFGARVTEFEVVDFAPPRTFGWVERGQRRGSKTFFRLDPAGEATSITVQIVWIPSSFFAWVRGRYFPKRDVQRQLSKTVENLRAALAG